MLNKLCKNLGASKIQRDSVPEGRLTEAKTEQFLQELMKSSEIWKSMKLIFIGHGQIGKTTLVTAFKKLLDPSFKVLFGIIDPWM